MADGATLAGLVPVARYVSSDSFIASTHHLSPGFWRSAAVNGVSVMARIASKASSLDTMTVFASDARTVIWLVS